MAVVKVHQSTANAGRGSLAYTLAKLHNDTVAYLSDGLIVDAGLAISGQAAEKFKTTETAVYRINGVQYTKAPADELTFTSNHVVTADKYGAILVQIDAAGTISTLVGEATQTTPMAYDSAAEAVAALPNPAAGNVALGYIIIKAEDSDGHGNWTANTDDMTDGSDVETATFVDADTKKLPDTITFYETGDPV